MIVTKFENAIKKHRLLEKGDRIIVGVSGGPDSVCLLDLLNKIRQKYDLKINIVHIDHGLRGRESLRDQNFVQNLAQRLKLPIIVEKVEARKYQKANNLSLEEAARDLRHKVFDKICQRKKISKVFLAHSASDQVETVLMNFIRGAGVKGLLGMDYQTNFKVNFGSKNEFKIIRPLLDCWRKEILKYLHDNKLEYCHDKTNDNIKFTRNYIRHKIIPQFRKLNLSFEENILAQANTLRLLKKQIDKNTHKIIESAKISKNGVEFSLEKWNQLDDFYKRETILALIRKVDSAKDIYRSQIEEFIDLLVNSSSGSFKMLPNSLVLYKNYDKIIISLKDQLLKKFKIKRQKLTISGTTVLAESENKIRTKFIRKIGRIPNKGMIVDYKKTGDKIFVRSRKNGDYFKPIGLRGRKKIQDFLVDQKIPKFERDCVPVLTNGKDQIIGLLGLRQDQRFSADGKAKKILLIELI